MTTRDTRPLDDARLEALLRARYAETAADSEPHELETVALYLDGKADEDQSRRAKAAIEADPLLAEAVATLRAMDGEQKVVSLAAARQRRSRPAQAWFGALAAALIATVGVIVFMTSTPTGPGGTEQMIGAGVGGPGAGDHLNIKVERATGSVVLRGEIAPQAGDSLSFTYTAPMPGFVAIMKLDGDGDSEVVYPADSANAAAIEAGKMVGLPVRAPYQPAEGCQWAVALFANDVFSLDDARRAIEGAQRDTASCTLAPSSEDLPGMRTVKHYLLQK